MLGAEGHDDVFVARDDDREVLVGRERTLDALEHGLGPLVASHGVDHNSNHL